MEDVKTFAGWWLKGATSCMLNLSDQNQNFSDERSHSLTCSLGIAGCDCVANFLVVRDAGRPPLDLVGHADRGSERRFNDIAQLDVEGVLGRPEDSHMEGDVCVKHIILALVGGFHTFKCRAY